ncbi:MAG: hypothetical protein U5L96_07225 [Owenweeksia sp.]|nr:hypothetical protein [Owenweeksia sp.]
MRFLISIFISVALSITARAQHLVEATFVSATPVGQLSAVSSDALFDVDQYKIRYRTTNVDGSRTTAQWCPNDTALHGL